LFFLITIGSIVVVSRSGNEPTSRTGVGFLSLYGTEIGIVFLNGASNTFLGNPLAVARSRLDEMLFVGRFGSLAWHDREVLSKKIKIGQFTSP